MEPTSRRATPSLPTVFVMSRSPIDVLLLSVTLSVVGAYPSPAGRSMMPGSPSNHAPSGTIYARQPSFVVPEDHANPSSALGSLNFSEITTGLPVSSESHVPGLPLARSFPHLQLSQEAAYSQAALTRCQFSTSAADL